MSSNTEDLIVVARQQVADAQTRLLAVTQDAHDALTSAAADTQARMTDAAAQAQASMASVTSTVRQQMEGAAQAVQDAKDNLARLQGIIAPPPLPPVLADPVSGLPWRSGFGQDAQLLTKLEAWRGRRAGVYSGWSNYTEAATDWNGLRGGALGKYDQMTGLFSTSGAYHLRLAWPLLDKRAVLIWVFPMLPANEANSRKGGAKNWSNPRVWERYATTQRADWRANWMDVGARTGNLLNTYSWPAEQFVFDLGWEATGQWYPWSVGPDGANFKNCWKAAVDAIRAGVEITCPGAGSKVRFQFRYAGEMWSDGNWNISTLWPGKDWSSTLGISAHASTSLWSQEANWALELAGNDRQTGLSRTVEFARAEGVQIGLNEWAIVRNQKSADHPADPKPYDAMKRFLGWCQDNAAMIAWECYLHSSQFTLLDSEKDWGGGKAYLEMIKPVA